METMADRHYEAYNMCMDELQDETDPARQEELRTLAAYQYRLYRLLRRLGRKG